MATPIKWLILLAATLLLVNGCSDDRSLFQKTMPPDYFWGPCYESMTGLTVEGEKISPAERAEQRASIRAAKFDCGQWQGQAGYTYAEHLQHAPPTATVTPVQCRKVGVDWKCD